MLQINSNRILVGRRVDLVKIKIPGLHSRLIAHIGTHISNLPFNDSDAYLLEIHCPRKICELQGCIINIELLQGKKVDVLVPSLESWCNGVLINV